MRFSILKDGTKIVIPNLITNRGYEEFSYRLGNTSSEAPFTWIAIGAGNIPPTVNDTSLGNELARTSTVFQYSSKSYEIAAQFEPGVGTGSITEVGVFNSSNGGTMCARSTFTAINKASGDTFVVLWENKFI